jgi:SNF2 family DNA or RNA helicase
VPIAPEAIERFLTAPLPWVPACKGMTPEDLQKLITTASGAALDPKTQPRPHQLEGAAWAIYRRRTLLFFWMRLGKTKIALDWASHLKRCGLTHKKGLVIAHAPIGADVWQSEVPKHSDLKATVVSSGNGSTDALIDALESDCDLIVIAHSTLQQLFSIKKLNRKGVPKLYPDVEALAIAAECFSFCIIDETHLCANHTSLRFDIVSGLVAKCRQRLGLSGTPVGRDPLAMWAQAFLIDEGQALSSNFYFFEAAFCKVRKARFGKRQNELVFDKLKLPALKQKMDTIALAYGKNEIKGADVYAGVVDLKMGPKQRDAYNELVTRLAEIEEDDERAKEAAFIRLRQIASGYLPFNDDEGDRRIVHFADSAKLAWFREFLADPPDAQCVFFHHFIHSGELLCAELAKAKVSHVSLRGEAGARREALASFQSGKSQVLVANAVTGGTAIDLPMADYLCFFESPVSPRLREQAEARPMARGDRPLLLDDLVCAPVERRILGFIKEGRDLASVLVHSSRKLAESLFAK